MVTCPYCGSDEDVEETDYYRDDDGSVCGWEYECCRCGCKFKHYIEEKIIEEGNPNWEDEDEDEDEEE